MTSRFSRRRPTANVQQLQKITTGSNQKKYILYTYTEVTENITTKISPEEQAEILELEGVSQNLEHSFKQVAAIEDPVKREYKILQEAKRLDIPLETYLRMWESHCIEKTPNRNEYFWLNPLKFLDQRLGDFVHWCENVSLYSLATVIGQFTLLAAMGAYFIEAPQREKQVLDDFFEKVFKNSLKHMKTLNNTIKDVDIQDKFEKKIADIEKRIFNYLEPFHMKLFHDDLNILSYNQRDIVRKTWEDSLSKNETLQLE